MHHGCIFNQGYRRQGEGDNAIFFSCQEVYFRSDNVHFLFSQRLLLVEDKYELFFLKWGTLSCCLDLLIFHLVMCSIYRSFFYLIFYRLSLKIIINLFSGYLAQCPCSFLSVFLLCHLVAIPRQHLLLSIIHQLGRTTKKFFFKHWKMFLLL